MSLKIALLLGSVRPARMADRVGSLLARMLATTGWEVTLIDPAQYRLPLLERMYKEYPTGTAPQPLAELAEIYRVADAFLIVSPEYNHGVPAALKNMLDHFLEEFFWRPSAILTYSAGRLGGAHAAVQLRAILAELGMPSIPSTVAIGNVEQTVSPQGECDASLEGAISRFIAELEWYANALKTGRTGGTPY